MKPLQILAMALAMILAIPAAAQDFGHPKDKAFYKAHWNDIVEDLGPDAYLRDAQYVLFDFDKDGRAELYLRISRMEEYLYAIKGNKAVRVSETERPIEDQYWLGSFYAHFMAPYELLLDKPVDQEMVTEQHLYDMFDVPGIWFKLHPQVKGTFNIKTAIEALYCFDCHKLSDAMYALYTGRYDRNEVDKEDGFVVDIANGYAKYSYNTETMNMVEFCYWNLPNGEKLLAMHYHFSDTLGDGNTEWFEQTLFMKYDAKTKQLEPIVAPIKGFDFQEEYSFGLPRRGKNIKLYGAEDRELKWTGSGFEY